MSAPAVAVSPDGKKVAAAWMDERTGKKVCKVFWAISSSTAFTEDSPVDPSTSHIQNHPALVIDASETVWAAWEDEDRSGRQTIWIRSSAKGTRDGKAVQLSDASQGNASFPALAAGGGVVGIVHEAGKRGEELAVFRRLK